MQGFRGTSVTVVGLGIEGIDLVRFFAAQGARVTVNDAKPPERLGPQLAAIAGLDVTFLLGDNRAEAADGADLVAVTQGAPLDLPPIRRARERGIPVTSLTELFLERCRGTVVGISGSSGKTTTTSLVAAIFAASGRASVLGGNIGLPLLSSVDAISPECWVILEVSHSQLVLTRRSPRIACLTNITPNHLDRFTWDEYVALKRNLIAHQTSSDITVLNLDNVLTRAMRADTAAECVFFSLGADLPGDGACVHSEQIVWRRSGQEQAVLPVSAVPLRGRHNVENAVCAAAIAGACGIQPEVTAAAIRQFRGVPHRLELVAESRGVSYYDDSIATAPERTLAGIRAFDQPLVLLLGGREKHLPLEELAAEVNQRCRAVICFGEAGDLLAAACRAAHPRGVCGVRIRRVGTLDEAVTLASRLARPGDAVLLSPACTSFDAYDNFERRGEAFRAAATSIEGVSPSLYQCGH
jgi:UDP-N-acetylmuramoylalanine--D-glutamate ligase